MPKIIHAADIHLDAPFSLFDVQKAQVRKNELRGVFSSLILLAKTEAADLVILSGDLFDSGFVTKETLTLMKTQFSSCPECKFVIAPGNHDCADNRSPYKKEVFPPNVYIFTNSEVERFSFPDIGVEVYGYAFTSPEMTENPLLAAIPLDRSKINILAAHCDLLGNSDNCPLTLNDIGRHGFDYAALGHIHKGGDVKMIGSTYYAYSGCLEGRSFDECGIKGAIIANLDKEKGYLRAEFTNRRLCKRHYEKMTVDITEMPNEEQMLDFVKNAVSGMGYGQDTLLRLTLVGRINPECDWNFKKITEKFLGVFYVEVKDETLPLLNGETLKNDISIRGALYRELLPLIEGDKEEERETAKEALKLGLAALDGRDFVDF